MSPPSTLNGSLIGPATLYPGTSTPAKPGETIVIYANGFDPRTYPLPADRQCREALYLRFQPFKSVASRLPSSSSHW